MIQAAEIPFASTRAAKERWRLVDDVELMTMPDPEFIIAGVLPRKGLAVVYGPSGSCKTTLVAGLQVAIATGRDWFGHAVCSRGGSVYLAAEDLAGYKIRLRSAKLAAGLSLDVSIGVYAFPEQLDLRDSISVNRFTAFMRAEGAATELIIIDTYAAATPGANENSSEDCTLAMTHAQRWRDELGTAVLIVHHTNAGGTRERGHSSMRGAADAMISMTAVDDTIHLECSKLRNAAPFAPLQLKLTPVPEGGCVLRLATDVLPSAGLTPVQEKVFTALRDTFASAGATKSEWRSSCQDVAERSFHRATKVLVEKGVVRQVGAHFCLSGGAE